MSMLTDIQFLSKRYLLKQIDLQHWKAYLVLIISRIEDDEKGSSLAKLLTNREEDDSNV